MSEIQWTPVTSSNIAAIGSRNYQTDGKADLFVRFNSGAEYVYHEVPQTVVQEFMDSESKGKFLNENIGAGR